MERRTPRGFWWVSRARAERRRGRRATGPQPGEDRSGESPASRNPPAALLTGGVSELAFSMWADGIPGGPPSPVLARGGRFRPLLTAIRLCTPLFRPATPLAGFLAGPPLDVRERTRHRDNAAALLVWGCGGTAGGPDVAARHKALVDGEGDDEGSASDAEPGADDCALQREGGWHAGGEVLGTSNPGDCPYDPDDCPSIEVVESETG